MITLVGMRKNNSFRIDLLFIIAAVLIAAFIVGTIARGFGLGNQALIEVRDRIVNGVSGTR